VYNESTITVYNHGRTSTPDGEVKDISGFAYLTEEAGKLFVDFGFDRLGNCKLASKMNAVLGHVRLASLIYKAILVLGQPRSM
jgi:hypothetical protein